MIPCAEHGETVPRCPGTLPPSRRARLASRRPRSRGSVNVAQTLAFAVGSVPTRLLDSCRSLPDPGSRRPLQGRSPGLASEEIIASCPPLLSWNSSTTTMGNASDNPTRDSRLGQQRRRRANRPARSRPRLSSGVPPCFEQAFASVARCSMQSCRPCSSGTVPEDLK